MLTIKKSVGALLCVVVMQFLSSSQAHAQTLYPGEVMRWAYGEVIYSPNGQYRISWVCGNGYCGVAQHVYSGGWNFRGYLLFGPVPNWAQPRLENYGGNLVLFDENGSFYGNTSDTYGSGNWLNVQDDGNLVVYDPNNNPLWTPACWYGNSPYPPPPSCPS